MDTDIAPVVDALPGLVWTARPDGYVDYLNHGWCVYTGLGATASMGSGWLQAIHPEDREQMDLGWRALVSAHKEPELDARLRRYDGTYRWFRFRSAAIVDDSGKIRKWCGLNTDIDDHRRAEASLRERETRFTLIVDGLPEMVTLWSASGVLEFANRNYLEYFGAELNDIVHWEKGHAFHPEDRDIAVSSMNHSVAIGAPFDLEARRRRADGVYRWFHIRGIPLRNPDGRIILWYLLHTDVDERKQTEAILAGERQLLEMAAGGRSMAEILESLCVFVERTATGCYCSVALLDSTRTHLDHGAAPSLPTRFIQSIIAEPLDTSSGPCAMATRLERPVVSADLTRETRWVSSHWWSMALSLGLRAVWATPVISKAGRVLGAFAIYYDRPSKPHPVHESIIGHLAHIASIAIERVANDAALRRGEALLAEAQRLSSTGSFAWRQDPEQFTCSAEFYRIYGFDPALPLTRSSMDARVHPEDLPVYQDRVLSMAGRTPEIEHEHRLVMPDGSIKYVHVVAHAVEDGLGRVEYLGAVQDVTLRRRSEEALSRARAELAHMARVMSLGALTASIAHEVNQPLSGIVTNASTCLRMLAADPPNVEGARETAQRTIRDGHRASDVITRLRALFGKKQMTRERLDLNEVAAEVIALLRSEIQGNKIMLRADLDETIPRVTGDRVQLQQVILNLLLNSCDAMSRVEGRARQLVIRTALEQSDRVLLSVEDAGVGIPTEDAARIFEAFYTTKPGGMGIGLSVSRSIIEEHAGRIWATPNSGHGATFSFSLPAPSSESPLDSEIEAHTPGESLGTHVRP